MTVDRFKEHLKTFMVFGGWMVPLAAFLVVWDSEGFKEWKDPRSYWAEKVTSGTAMSKFYAMEVKDCREHHSKLIAPDARRIWVAQKELEGMSAVEGARDYEISVKASKDACEAFVGIQQLNTLKYEEAKRKLDAAK